MEKHIMDADLLVWIMQEKEKWVADCLIKNDLTHGQCEIQKETVGFTMNERMLYGGKVIGTFSVWTEDGRKVQISADVTNIHEM